MDGVQCTSGKYWPLDFRQIDHVKKKSCYHNCGNGIYWLFLCLFSKLYRNLVTLFAMLKNEAKKKKNQNLNVQNATRKILNESDTKNLQWYKTTGF